jgi:hypothetical protein
MLQNAKAQQTNKNTFTVITPNTTFICSWWTVLGSSQKKWNTEVEGTPLASLTLCPNIAT